MCPPFSRTPSTPRVTQSREPRTVEVGVEGGVADNQPHGSRRDGAGNQVRVSQGNSTPGVGSRWLGM